MELSEYLTGVMVGGAAVGLALYLQAAALPSFPRINSRRDWVITLITYGIALILISMGVKLL